MKINQKSSLNLIYILWLHVPKFRQKQLLFIILLMFISSVAEVISIGLVVPFLATLANPEMIFNFELAQPIVKFFNIVEPDQVVYPFILLFLCAVLFSGVVRLIMLSTLIKMGQFIGADLSVNIYSKTLRQNYSQHMTKNSSEVIAGLTQKTNGIVTLVILPVLFILSGSLVLFLVIVTFLLFEPLLSIIAFVGFGSIYFFIVLLSKKRLSTDSEIISYQQVEIYKNIQESLSGIREIIIDGTQNYFYDIFKKTDFLLRKSLASIQIISSVPRVGIETLGLILVSVIAFYLVKDSDGISEVLPVLGAFALAAQKMLPVMQQIYSSVTNIKAGKMILSDTLDLLDQPINNLDYKNDKLNFKNNLTLSDVSFSYDKDKKPVLSNINLNITKGSWIGFFGKTGGGKSTLLDIILGLLHPSKGKLTVDGIEITEKNYRGWHQNIANIPQNIILSDDTITNNIAFGIKKNEINQTKILNAVKQAKIYADINSFDKKFDTVVGENGVRLSGGQKQRIAIARALYKNANVLILDEATSALDAETEKLIIKEIKKIKKRITVIMVSHRLSTLKDNCNAIVEVKNNTIKIIDTNN